MKRRETYFLAKANFAQCIALGIFIFCFFLFYMTLVSHLHVCTGYTQFLIKIAAHVGQRNPFNGREFMTVLVDTC